jgi:hypothetical protein
VGAIFKKSTLPLSSYLIASLTAKLRWRHYSFQLKFSLFDEQQKAIGQVNFMNLILKTASN